jgi:hypothetical protein
MPQLNTVALFYLTTTLELLGTSQPGMHRFAEYQRLFTADWMLASEWQAGNP